MSTHMIETVKVFVEDVKLQEKAYAAAETDFDDRARRIMNARTALEAAFADLRRLSLFEKSDELDNLVVRVASEATEHEKTRVALKSRKQGLDDARKALEDAMRCILSTRNDIESTTQSCRHDINETDPQPMCIQAAGCPFKSDDVPIAAGNSSLVDAFAACANDLCILAKSQSLRRAPTFDLPDFA
jgi:hypothetical protein